MNFFESLNPDFVAWVIMPIIIIVARMIDVSMGTFRIILVSKGFRLYASVLGFLEILLWITVVGQIMGNMNNFIYYISYALGFSFGTSIGMYIEKKISLGMVIVRIITKYEATELLEYLRAKDFDATCTDGYGKYGQVKILFMVIKRHDLDNLIALIKKFNPNAFYTVEDLRYVSGGVIPDKPRTGFFTKLQLSKFKLQKRK